jgi:hypothetical protein
MLEAIAVAWLLLFFGDFFSTFLYHIPEHVFGRLHLQTHHSWKKNTSTLRNFNFQFPGSFRWYFGCFAILAISNILMGFLSGWRYLWVAFWSVSCMVETHKCLGLGNSQVFEDAVSGFIYNYTGKTLATSSKN